MMDAVVSILSVVLAALMLGVSVFVNSFTVKRLQKIDTSADAKTIATIMADLGHVVKGIDEIKQELKSLACDVGRLRDRVAELEVKVGRIHERVQNLENREG